MSLSGFSSWFCLPRFLTRIPIVFSKSVEYKTWLTTLKNMKITARTPIAGRSCKRANRIVNLVLELYCSFLNSGSRCIVLMWLQYKIVDITGVFGWDLELNWVSLWGFSYLLFHSQPSQKYMIWKHTCFRGRLSSFIMYSILQTSILNMH